MKQPANIARNLHEIRKSHNLNLDKLSERTGVSKSMLRQIEKGQSSPTIATLWKIANGLRIPFTALLREHTPEIVQKPFKNVEQMMDELEGYRLFPLLAFKPERAIESYYVEIDPGTALDAEPHQSNTEEYVFVIQGQIRITVIDQDYTVEQQNFISFPADCIHRYENTADVMASAIMMISYLP